MGTTAKASPKRRKAATGLLDRDYILGSVRVGNVDAMDGAKDVKDEIWMRDEVQSPCIKLCVVHPEERLCVGCFRTIDEIATWSQKTPSERARIMADLPDRAPRLRQRRGGRMARLDR
jgi:uncharacterized protein